MKDWNFAICPFRQSLSQSQVNGQPLCFVVPLAFMYIPKKIYMKIKTYNNDYKTYNRENWKFDWKPELLLADWNHEYKWLKVWIIFETILQ